jgi:hypothetical protein
VGLCFALPCVSLVSVVLAVYLRRDDHRTSGVVRECGVSEGDRVATTDCLPLLRRGCCAPGGWKSEFVKHNAYIR